jgi:uncharacterized OB-fold protein
MAEKKKYVKPLPRIDEESKGFWEACERGELYVQRCGDCGETRFYPRALCPECLSDRSEWLRCSGTGTVYTFTVVNQNQAPGFRDELPYVLAYVELEEGPRMLTNIVDCKPDDVAIGMAVEVVFDDVSPKVTLPRFRPTA